MCVVTETEKTLLLQEILKQGDGTTRCGIYGIEITTHSLSLIHANEEEWPTLFVPADSHVWQGIHSNHAEIEAQNHHSFQCPFCTFLFQLTPHPSPVLVLQLRKLRRVERIQGLYPSSRDYSAPQQGSHIVNDSRSFSPSGRVAFAPVFLTFPERVSPSTEHPQKRLVLSTHRMLSYPLTVEDFWEGLSVVQGLPPFHHHPASLTF